MTTEASVKDLRGNTHTVRRCSLKDIAFHFEIVKYLIPKDEHKDYQKVMADCVETGLAFCINDSCFIYMKKSKPKFLEAFSFYGKNNPLKTLAMFAYILKEIDKEVIFLRFFPHSASLVSDIKSLLTPTAIFRQKSGINKTITVRCDALREKLTKLYDARNV